MTSPLLKRSITSLLAAKAPLYVTSIISPSSVLIVPRTSSRNDPSGMIISQSPVGGTMVPLIFGPRTVPPAGTLTIARKPADWGGSRGASTVARYSVSTDTVGVCIIHSSLWNLHWFDRPHEGDDRIDIGRCHLGIPVV